MYNPQTANGHSGSNVDTRPKLAGAVVVTTPQAISTADVRKELNFCVKTQVPVLGVIENMAGYMCPCCNEITNIFSKGGGEIMARETGVPFLGSVPLDTGFVALVEGAKDDQNSSQSVNGSDSIHSTELVERYKSCGLNPLFTDFATKIHQKINNLEGSMP